MANGIYIAVSGAQAELRKLDVISNNLANNNTAGFKRDRVSFREVLANNMVDDASQDRRFVEVAETATDMRGGGLRETGNPLDLAVMGDGFFKVQTERGVRLTRGGSFLQNSNGQMMTNQGYPLLGQDNQPVSFPPGGGTPVITATGDVRFRGESVGSLAVVEARDVTALRKEEGGLFATDAGNMVDSPSTHVHQGYIEHSNGDSVRMMVSLVETQRHFDALHRAIETYKDLDMKVSRIVS